MWIDVKKVYDSVNHECLIECLGRLNIPLSCIKFIKSLTDDLEINLNDNKKVIGNIGLERGILQGDSFSPLLFALCMEPLSRKLNISHETVSIEEGSDWFRTNHLIFIDDIKLFAKSEEVLRGGYNTSRNFLDLVGSESTKANLLLMQNLAKVKLSLEEHEGYKYLGVLEDRNNLIKPETKQKIVENIYVRVIKIRKSKLNARNLFHAINEHATSLMNYYIGLVEFEPCELTEIDNSIRILLRENRIHFRAGNKERLYLSRSELGRVLRNGNHKCEKILLNMYYFWKTESTCAVEKTQS